MGFGADSPVWPASVDGVRTATVLTAGRWARLVLLLCTLVGLAGMHTLGHAGGGHGGGHDRPGPAGAHPAASATFRVSAVTDVMGMAFPVGHATGAAPSVGHATGGAVFLVGLMRVGPVRVPSGGCPVDGCPTAWLPAGDPGAGPPGWSICLAVFGALAVALLVAVLLLGGVRSAGLSARRPGGPSAGPRAPPPRPIGLWLAEISVSRT